MRSAFLAESFWSYGKQSGTRQMIQVLSLLKRHGHARVRAAVEEARSLGCAQAAVLEAATSGPQSKVLRLPPGAAPCARLAEQAGRARRTHLGYREALLQAELADRELRLVKRRSREARRPRARAGGRYDLIAIDEVAYVPLAVGKQGSCGRGSWSALVTPRAHGPCCAQRPARIG